MRTRAYVAISVLGLLLLAVWLALPLSLQRFEVLGASMVPTLKEGDYILVDKISYHFHPPARGDIVVFRYPGDTSRDFIKRVIAVPGDKIAIKRENGTYHVFVNNKMLNQLYSNEAPDGPYPADCAAPKTCTPETVQPKHVFVMGDNPGASFDSRSWGQLPMSDMIGRARISYWPLSHLSLLPS